MLTVRILGGASIEGDAGPLAGPATQRHRLALLALLATSRPGGLGRDKLLAYLWPTRDDVRARHLLNQSVYVLRKALGGRAILSAGDELRLDPRAVRIDVLEFREALEDGDLERAVELYRGPFLDGLFLPDAVEFERRVDADRARLRDGHRRALEGLAEAARARHEMAEAAGWWRRLAAESPYDSRVTLELMETLRGAGARGEALRHARRHMVLLERDLGAEPDPAVVELAERIRTDARPGPGADGPRADPGARPNDEEEAAGADGGGEDGGDAPPPAGDSLPARGRPAASAQPGPGSGPPDADRSAPPGPILGEGPEAAIRPRPRFRARTVRRAMAAVVLLLFGGAAVIALPGEGPDVERVAVLPLANLTGEPRQEHFVAGMHDALVTELGRVAELTVVSRQSVLRYRGSEEPLPVIARELEVDALVEGAVFLAGDSVRITAQLVRGEPEEHVWSGVYRGSLKEALALQGEVARAVAEAVHARTRQPAGPALAGRRSVDPEAQEAYLLGRYELERLMVETLPQGTPWRVLRTAVGHLEKAAELDPEWAAAHAQLALAYHWLASLSHAGEDTLHAKSKVAALRALELDDSEARAHASLGFVRFFFDGDWKGAERAYRRALQLDPNAHHADYAFYLSTAGRYDAAVTHYREAEERNPTSRLLKRQVARALFCAARYDEAVAQAKVTARLWPERDATPTHGLLGNAYSAKSMHAEAVAEFQRAVALSDSASWALSGLAYAQARAGRPGKARGIVEKHVREVDPILYAALGETGKAVAMIEANVRRQGLRAFGDLRCFPEWEELRTEPRIRELLRRVGLAGRRTASGASARR